MVKKINQLTTKSKKIMDILKLVHVLIFCGLGKSSRNRSLTMQENLIKTREIKKGYD